MAEIKRCTDPADPNRCQGVIRSRGQCNNLAAEGSKFCLAHGGNRAQNEADKQSLRNYRLTRWTARIQQQADSPAIKSLRDEIGILRILMEERLNKCETEMDLILHSQAIADLVMKIEHVVVSCHKLEDKLKYVVDRSALLQFATMVIDIVATVINELIEDQALADQILQRISDAILQSIGKIGEEE